MNYFEIKITPVDSLNKGDKVNITYDIKKFEDFIKERNSLLNDIIYLEKIKFIKTKENYNNSFTKIINSIKKMGIIEVTKCESVAMQTVEPVKQQLEQEKQLRIQEQIKFEQKIEMLMNRINELEKNK